MEPQPEELAIGAVAVGSFAVLSVSRESRPDGRRARQHRDKRLIGRRSRKLCHAFGQLVQTVDLGRERLREMIDLLQARVYRNRWGCACRTGKMTYRARYYTIHCMA